MAKKNFQAAPKPQANISDKTVDAFVQSGAGQDTKTLKPSNVGSLEEKTKRLSLDLPENTHLRFKTACSATGRKMTREIETFILERTTQLEKEAGITRK